MIELSVFTRIGPAAAALAVGVTLAFAPSASAAMPQAKLVATLDLSSPHQIVVSPTTGGIYVTGEGRTDPIRVIDPATNTVRATIPVDDDHITNVALAVHPTTGVLFLARDHVEQPGSLSMIDPITNTVTRTVPIGTYPTGLAVNPRTGKIYIAEHGTKLRVLDAGALATEAVIELGAGEAVVGGIVAVNPANDKVYVTKAGTAATAATTTIIDARTNTVITAVPAPDTPNGLAVNPVNGNAYVAGDNAISVVSGTQNTEVARVPTRSQYWRRIAVKPDAGQIFYGVRNGIEVLDPDSNKILGTIPLEGSDLRPIALSGDRIYVGNTGGGKVYVLRILNPE
jgi:YVTN family beta-propeller protein